MAYREQLWAAPRTPPISERASRSAKGRANRYPNPKAGTALRQQPDQGTQDSTQC
jgi:hypothetical protein